jgi:hypothetical protein
MEESQANNPLTFNVYPNPANDLVTIAFSSDNTASYSLQLFDMTGRIIKTDVDNARIGENTHTMGLDGIAKGVYIIELRVGETISKAKLMVQ